MTTATAPLCPKHGTPMRPSQYDEGGYYCPKDDATTLKGKCVEQVKGTGKKLAPAAAADTSIAIVPVLPPWIAEHVAQFINNPDYELLLPAIPFNLERNPLYRPSFTIVQLNPDEDAHQSGYKDGAKLFSFNKAGLEKLADAAAISFVNLRRVDDRKDPDYCDHVITGRMLNASGVMRELEDNGPIYMPDVIAEDWRQRVAQNENAKEGKQRTEAQMRKDHEAFVASFRRYIGRRSATAAAERVTRKLLAIRGGLTRERIAKKKVLMRMDLDMNNAMVQRATLDRGRDAQNALYGRSTGSLAEVIDTPEPLPQEPLNLGNAPTTEDPAAQALLDDISKAAEVLAWPEAMVETLIQKHGGDLAKARAEIVRYVDGAK